MLSAFRKHFYLILLYFIMGINISSPIHQAVKSPFVERLLKKGYEVLYLVEPVDEYCIQSLPEFEGKKFQNVAKEGLKLDQSDKAKEAREALEKEYEPLLKWMKDNALSDKVCSHIPPPPPPFQYHDKMNTTQLHETARWFVHEPILGSIFVSVLPVEWFLSYRAFSL